MVLCYIGDDFFAAYNRTFYNNLYVLDTQTWTWYEPEIQGTAPMRRSFATSALITNEYAVFAFGRLAKAIVKDYYAHLSR